MEYIGNRLFMKHFLSLLKKEMVSGVSLIRPEDHSVTNVIDGACSKYVSYSFIIRTVRLKSESQL